MKKLKYLIILTFYFSFSQNNTESLNDFERISFFVDIINKDFNESSKEFILNKFQRVVFNQNFGDTNEDRFGLIINPIIQTEEYTNTVPSKYYIDLSLNVYAIDYIEKKQLGLFSIDNLRGINSNKERSIISALRDFKKTESLDKFIIEVKNKVISYYDTQCEFIIEESINLSKMNQFNQSLSLLNRIPRVSKKCYQDAQQNILDIYSKKIENECQKLISESKVLLLNQKYDQASNLLKTIIPGLNCYDEAIILINEIQEYWCSSNLSKASNARSIRNFKEASKYLSLIPDKSPCSGNATILRDSIYSELTEIEKRDWEFNLKRYNDELSLERDKMSFELDKQEIISKSLIEQSKYLSKMNIQVRNYDFLGYRN